MSNLGRRHGDSHERSRDRRSLVVELTRMHRSLRVLSRQSDNRFEGRRHGDSRERSRDRRDFGGLARK